MLRFAQHDNLGVFRIRLVGRWTGRPRFFGLHVDGGLAALGGGADCAAFRAGALRATGAVNASVNVFHSGFLGRLRGAWLLRRSALFGSGWVEFGDLGPARQLGSFLLFFFGAGFRFFLRSALGGLFSAHARDLFELRFFLLPGGFFRRVFFRRPGVGALSGQGRHKYKG